MLKCHSELFKSSVKLADGLRLSTKEELKDVAQLLLLPIPSKLRKEEYVSCLAEAVLTCPDIWIPQLTHYEWLLLQKLVKAGANTYVEEPNMIMTSTLELLSFVATDRGLNGDKIRYMICDELREAVAPHIDKFLAVLQVFGCIGLLFHLHRIIVGRLFFVFFLIIGVFRFDEYIS